MNFSGYSSIPRLFIAFLFIVFLVLVQTSFPFFVVPPYIFLILFVILYNALEKEESKEGLFLAVFAGFWFDVFTESVMGGYMLLFLVLAFLFKIALKRYVKVPSFS